MFVFTQWCDCQHANQDAREKRHCKFEPCVDQIPLDYEPTSWNFLTWKQLSDLSENEYMWYLDTCLCVYGICKDLD